MLKLSCRDHKTFSLHLGLHIGYKDYICLLVYSINCIFPTAKTVAVLPEWHPGEATRKKPRATPQATPNENMNFDT